MKETVVNTQTIEQWDIVSKHYSIEWAVIYIGDGLKIHPHSQFVEDTCINIDTHKYCCLEYYKQENYKIMSFDEWKKVNKS